MVPEGLRGILYLNPLSYYVLAFQQVVCYGRMPDLPILLTATAISAVVFIGGFTFFRRAKFAFFDYA
jgi:ABC-type polysaccharide/polyol phosphate export permease